MLTCLVLGHNKPESSPHNWHTAWVEWERWDLTFLTATRRGAVAAANGVTVPTEASGGSALAEGAAGFLRVAEERGGRAGLHRKG